MSDTQHFCRAASIDLKKEEAGILAFCETAMRFRMWNLSLIRTEELMDLEGDFTASAFVKETTGVDCVCERSASSLQRWRCRAASAGRRAANGVTVALALEEDMVDFAL